MKLSSFSALAIGIGLSLTLSAGAVHATKAILQFEGQVTRNWNYTGSWIESPVGAPAVGTVNYDADSFGIENEFDDPSVPYGYVLYNKLANSAGNVSTLQLGNFTLTGELLTIHVFRNIENGDGNPPADRLYLRGRIPECPMSTMGFSPGCEFDFIANVPAGAWTSLSIPTEFSGPIHNWGVYGYIWNDVNGTTEYKLSRFSITPVAPPPQSITVAMVVKVGGDLAPINPKSNGVVPVAIMTTDDFDALSVDPASLNFGAEGRADGTGASPASYNLEDVDDDQRPDLVAHFRTQETGIVCGATLATLVGLTSSDQEINGSASIKTVGCK